jgi:hypothetical protein
MFVEIDVRRDSAGEAVLREEDDFGAFKILIHARDLSEPAVTAALEKLGTVDPDGHVWLAIDTVKALAGLRAHDDAWLSSFERMLGYAAGLGFVDAERQRMRAHCELAPED